MNTTVHWQIRPEERELERKQAELAALEENLEERELAFETFKAELKAFERQYQSIVGMRYAELEEIVAQLAEAQSRRNGAQASAYGHSQAGESFWDSGGELC